MTEPFRSRTFRALPADQRPRKTRRGVRVVVTDGEAAGIEALTAEHAPAEVVTVAPSELAGLEGQWFDDIVFYGADADAIEAAQQTFDTAASIEDEPGVDLSKLARPTSTWTYMVHDNPLNDDTLSALSLPGVFR